MRASVVVCVSAVANEGMRGGKDDGGCRNAL